jgi:hypothetical protein
LGLAGTTLPQARWMTAQATIGGLALLRLNLPA